MGMFFVDLSHIYMIYEYDYILIFYIKIKSYAYIYAYVHIHLVFNKQIKYFIITIYIIFMYISFCPFFIFSHSLTIKYIISRSHTKMVVCYICFFFLSLLSKMLNTSSFKKITMYIIVFTPRFKHYKS